MKSLLVVAHGSRRAESNEEVRALTQKLADRAGEEFVQIECAFLELAEPTIPDGLRAAITAGATDIVVVPYFLSAGRHVVSDIPSEVDKVRAECAAVTITIANYLGAAPSLDELLLEQAYKARE